MNGPRTRWISSFLVISGATVIAFAALEIPAQAASRVQGTIVAGRTGLSVRSGATTLSARSGSIRTGTKVMIQCQVVGQSVKGRVRRTNRWNRLVDGRYVSDAYVRRTGSLPLCPVAIPVVATITPSTVLPPIYGGTPVGKWIAPVPYRTVPGYRTASRPTHDGTDFMAPRWTPIRATAAGHVVTVECNDSTGNCDVDGSPAHRGCGWYAEVLHAADVVTRYCHMVRRPEVVVGQPVTVGQILGYVGSSGRSSAPHLHFEVHSSHPATRLNAVSPIEFMKRAKAPIAR